MQPSTPPRPRIPDPRPFRAFADRLGFWRLCGRSACAHARACRGEPRRCFTRCVPRMPAEDYWRLARAVERLEWEAEIRDLMAAVTQQLRAALARMCAKSSPPRVLIE